LNPRRHGDGLSFLARHAPPQLVAIVTVALSSVTVIGIDVKMLCTIPGLNIAKINTRSTMPTTTSSTTVVRFGLVDEYE